MHSVELPGKILADFCSPDGMALIVYDMQIGILRQMQDAGAIVERVADALDAARSAGGGSTRRPR